jgi:hypothetical protein
MSINPATSPQTQAKPQNSKPTQTTALPKHIVGTVDMEWAPSRRVDVASKGQLGELKCEVGLPL